MNFGVLNEDRNQIQFANEMKIVFLEEQTASSTYV